jgi:hypothetical protein
LVGNQGVCELGWPKKWQGKSCFKIHFGDFFYTKSKCDIIQGIPKLQVFKFYSIEICTCKGH